MRHQVILPDCQVMHLLLSRKADPTIADDDGQRPSAVVCALWDNKLKLVRYTRDAMVKALKVRSKPVRGTRNASVFYTCA
jgi:hypothetical protein